MPTGDYSHKIHLRAFGMEASASGWGIAALLLLIIAGLSGRAVGWW